MRRLGWAKNKLGLGWCKRSLRASDSKRMSDHGGLTQQGSWSKLARLRVRRLESVSTLVEAGLRHAVQFRHLCKSKCGGPTLKGLELGTKVALDRAAAVPFDIGPMPTHDTCIGEAKWKRPSPERAEAPRQTESREPRKRHKSFDLPLPPLPTVPCPGYVPTVNLRAETLRGCWPHHLKLTDYRNHIRFPPAGCPGWMLEGESPASVVLQLHDARAERQEDLPLSSPLLLLLRINLSLCRLIASKTIEAEAGGFLPATR